MRRKKKAWNPTAFKMIENGLRFKRRVDFPCWHHEHIEKIARLLIEYGKSIEEIGKMETMLNHEKVSLIQWQIQRLNWDASRLTPHDPRERGAAMSTYMNGRTYMTDMNGVDHVQARDDLDEQFEPGPNMRKHRTGARPE